MNSSGPSRRSGWGRRLICALFCFGAVVATAVAQTGDTADLVRPELGKLLVAVQDLLKENKNQEALAKLGEADSIPDRTPSEDFDIARLRAVAAARVGDTATAAKSLEVVVESKQLPAAEQLKLVESLGILYFQGGDTPKAVTWLSRYFQEGGSDPQHRLLLAQARYDTHDYATAARELRAMVDADDRTGKAPPLNQLQMLLNCYGKQNDNDGYAYALEKLLVYYPKKEYWVEAVRRVRQKPGFADYLTLDLFRLLQAAGALQTADQYMEMAQLALRSGFPAEAKNLVEQGFAGGILGSGTNTDAQRKLRDTATKQAADDEKTWEKDLKSAGAAKDGTVFFNTGFALIYAGRFDQGLSLMEQGVQKGGLKRPEEAKLHLAIAYTLAGQKPKAVEAFTAVQGADGTADLARLWQIYIQKTPG